MGAVFHFRNVRVTVHMVAKNAANSKKALDDLEVCFIHLELCEREHICQLLVSFI